MELLEAALKHSIGWSMRMRRKINQQLQVRPAAPASETVELANLKIRDESHVRAFVTHFKIQLNHLMGAKCQGESTDQEGSLSELDSSVCFEDSGEQLRGSPKSAEQAPGKPRIRINGKYSGVYDLNGQSDEDDDDQVDQHAGQFKTCKPSKQTNEEVDDGYRSLSRNGSSRTSLMQQLNDIKSRIVDLVCELDSNPVVGQLNEDDLNAYRRRRDALVAKLDALIESQRPMTPANQALHSSSSSSASSMSTSSSSSSSASASRASKGRRQSVIKNHNYESNIYSNGYEEQVQVIDYNNKRHRSNPLTILEDQTKQQVTRATEPLIVNSSMTRVNVSKSPLSLAPNKQPIDFGAMMRNYDEKQEHRQQSTTKKDNTNHTPSSSSTSTHSFSSQASTSSFI